MGRAPTFIPDSWRNEQYQYFHDMFNRRQCITCYDDLKAYIRNSNLTWAEIRYCVQQFKEGGFVEV